MISREELDNLLGEVLKGNWQARQKIRRYFDREIRINTRTFADVPPAKEEQKRYVVRFLTEASEKGNHFATAYLGIFYRDGTGVATDINRAVALYRTAANANNVWGLVDLAICFRDGKGVDKDTGQALELAKRAANQNFPYGQCQVAYILDKCIKDGTDRKAEADRWYQLAAQNGDAYAFMKLNFEGRIWTSKSNNFKSLMMDHAFTIYLPVNRDIKCSLTPNTKTEVSGSIYEGEGTISSHQVLTSYTFTIRYTGPVNIGDRELCKKKIGNIWNEELDKVNAESGPCFIDCCGIKFGVVRTTRLKMAHGRAEIRLEEMLAGFFKEADEQLSRRIAEVERIEKSRKEGDAHRVLVAGPIPVSAVPPAMLISAEAAVPARVSPDAAPRPQLAAPVQATPMITLSQEQLQALVQAEVAKATRAAPPSMG